MGKMGELAAQLSELKRCGEILIGISDTLTELFSGEPENGKETAGGAPAKKEAVKKAVTKAEPEVKAPTMEEVRAVLAEKSRAGHTAKVKELLEKHGAPKLSGIDPAEYPALLAEVEVL
ncbi:DNA ligase [Clostridium botulinum]|uniref:DNA ligase n=1 Tax=Clostridium botulinum TaxID=1491 RepID=UPI00196A19B2|nr:DNA ligase [Clostridium botulinum]MBN3368706.1 DNA ligase [Clostridium botulinum]